jgi:hypothetical protein
MQLEYQPALGTNLVMEQGAEGYHLLQTSDTLLTTSQPGAIGREKKAALGQKPSGPVR